ncbi:MAG: F0F1 ATP synthase subunit C [Deltaproteobacteria bacterium]|jgi:V/A-type H+-transporting ATPase subunit K|nr:F0F1 ATP synthase subunit C [Deltaproteobacteria bacterium]
MKAKILSILGFLFASSLVLASRAFAAAAPGGHGGNFADHGMYAIGMGLAVGLSAIGTGLAQARIGAAGLGSAVEKPESLGLALIFLLLPETLVIFGLVVAFLLLGKL